MDVKLTSKQKELLETIYNTQVTFWYGSDTGRFNTAPIKFKLVTLDKLRQLDLVLVRSVGNGVDYNAYVSNKGRKIVEQKLDKVPV